MFDGFKAKCNVSPETWIECDSLPFVGKYYARTGEALRVPLVAEFQALKFELIPSTVSDNTHAILRGSLHRFFNGGGTNATRFTLENVREVLEILQQNFGIEPTETVLQNLEFGVNIETPLPAQWYIKNLVAYGASRFVELVLERVKVGKQCIKQRYTIKIYDKGTQAKDSRKNILRIEVRVAKMEALKPYGITTLADLADRMKIAPLGAFLASVVDSIVMFDIKAETDKMTRPEMKRFMQYQTANFWEDVGHKKRSEHIKAYRELCEKYGIQQPTNELSQAVKMEWNTLLNNGVFVPTFENYSTEKEGRFNQLLKVESGGVLTDIIHGYNAPYKIDKTQIVQMTKKLNMKRNKKRVNEFIFCPPPPQIFKQKFCVSCGRQIFYQRKQSRFCSAMYVGEKRAKHCRNIESGKVRTWKRRIKTATEKNLFVVISTGGESVMLHPSEITITKQAVRTVSDLRILSICSQTVSEIRTNHNHSPQPFCHNVDTLQMVENNEANKKTEQYAKATETLTHRRNKRKTIPETHPPPKPLHTDKQRQTATTTTRVNSKRKPRPR